jgi:hypothetical protein
MQEKLIVASWPTSLTNHIHCLSEVQFRYLPSLGLKSLLGMPKTRKLPFVVDLATFVINSFVDNLTAVPARFQGD